MNDIENDLMDFDELEPEEFEENFDIDYSLTSYGIDFDVDGLVRRFGKGKITVPEFQRDYVWNPRKASKFIESLLLGLPVPGIFLLKEDKTSETVDQLLVIDGLQRLTTLHSYLENDLNGKPFKLVGVHSRFNNKTFDQLEPEDKTKLEDSMIHATVVKPDDPKERNTESVYLIFERLNTGGMNLSPQEIRNCIYQGELLEQIHNLSNIDEFSKLLNINTKRKKHEEICLRLIALTFSYKDYTGNMKVFLNNFLDLNRNHDFIEKDKIENIFKKTLNILYENVGSEIFRLGTGPINLAIVDSIFVGLALCNLNGINLDQSNVKNKLKGIVESKDFKETIKTGRTHNTESVKSRINLIYKILSND